MQSIFVFPGNVYLLMMLFLFVALCTTTLSDKIEEKANGTLKDNANVDANSIVSDLQNGKRVVFAVGPVNSKITLFISGPGGKTDVASGCTVQVEENNNGIFKITNPPSKMPNGVSSADAIFVCLDSPSGSKLVKMSSSKVEAVNLPDGGAVTLNIFHIPACFYSEYIYLPSNTPLYYYPVGPNGKVRYANFLGDNITSSEICDPGKPAKKVCTNGNKIKVKKGCQGSTIPNLVSGYVSGSTAYLFDTANTVYVFDASAFTSEESVDLKKVSSKEAWKGSTSVRPSSKLKPEPKVKTTSANDKSAIIFVMLGILALLLIFFCILIYCCFFRGGSRKSSTKKGKQAVSGKKNKSKKNFKKAIGSKKKSTISKSSRSASKKTFTTSKSGKKGSKSSKGSKSLKGKSSKSSKSSKVKSFKIKGSKLKISKDKGSVARGRRSSTKLQKKSASRKTTALSGR